MAIRIGGTTWRGPLSKRRQWHRASWYIRFGCAFQPPGNYFNTRLCRLEIKFHPDEPHRRLEGPTRLMLASRSSSLNIPPVPVVCVPVLHIPRRSLSLVLVLLALVLVQRPVVAWQNVTFQDTSPFLQYSPEVCDGTTTNTSAAQGGGVVQSCIGAWWVCLCSSELV